MGTLVLCGGAPKIMCIRCSRSTWALTRVHVDGANYDQEEIMEPTVQPSKHATSRRSFLHKGLVVGGAGTIGAGLLAGGVALPAFAEKESGGPTPGDEAILRFLSAAEILETDLWQQYNELGGIQDTEVPGGSRRPAHNTALQRPRGDNRRY